MVVRIYCNINPSCSFLPDIVFWSYEVKKGCVSHLMSWETLNHINYPIPSHLEQIFTTLQEWFNSTIVMKGTISLLYFSKLEAFTLAWNQYRFLWFKLLKLQSYFSKLQVYVSEISTPEWRTTFGAGLSSFYMVATWFTYVFGKVRIFIFIDKKCNIRCLLAKYINYICIKGW